MSNWRDGELELESGVLLLPEGRADRKLFEKLIESRAGTPKFDMPWPTTEDERPHLPATGNHHKYYGREGFARMLKAVAQSMVLDYCEVRGILMATDAGDDPAEAFENVRRQIREANKASGAGEFPLPSAAGQIALGKGGMPSVEVMLVPPSGQGSLETLCVECLKKRWPDVHAAAAAYLTTPPTDISAWNTEKQSKSRFQCMVAGKHKDDPTMSVYGALERGLIDPKDPLFDDIHDRLKSFAANLP